MLTEHFHTASIHESARVPYWNQVANDVFGAIAIQPCSRKFSAKLRHRCFGRVKLTHVESSPVTITGERTAQPPGVYLLMNISGNSGYAQYGRKTTLKPGELTVLDAHKPYVIEASSDHVTRVLSIPDEALCHKLGDHIAVSHNSQDCALLTTLMNRLDLLDNQANGPGNLLQTTLDLIELSWPTQRKQTRRNDFSVWETRLKRFIAQHLGEADLCAERIAHSLGISPRYVQMLFSRMGTTVSQYILRSRLQAVAERLQQEDGQRISDIALEAGFNDLSYFCRCFRNHFGISAREYRSL